MVKFKKFTIKKYDSLEPYFDKRTMKIHSEKHHEAYTNKLNDELKRLKLKESSIEKILSKKVLTPALKNNGGGYFNHNVFFSQLKKNVKPTKKF